MRTIFSLVLIAFLSVVCLAQEPISHGAVTQPMAQPVTVVQGTAVQQSVVTQPTVVSTSPTQSTPRQENNIIPASLTVSLYQPTQPQNTQPVASVCGCARQ